MKTVSQKPKGYQSFLGRVFIITLIPVTVAGGIFLLLSLYLCLKEASFLRVREIRIEGNRRISTNEILAITGLKEGPNILALDIRALNRRLGQHPWIEKAMVKRRFPDGIHIVIEERKPLALIHLGRLYYVDQQGAIFHQAKDQEKAAYPILTGIRREDLEKGEKTACRLLQKALDLLRMTHGAGILPYRSISQIHMDRAIGLLVYTIDRGTEIRMGFDGFEGKFQRLSKIWPAIRSMEPDIVDCNIPEKIIVQPKRSDNMNASRQKTNPKKTK
jgi:cell division protein FtsQ